MVPPNENNAKKIWTELRKYLPVFALFKSDRASIDTDPEAQDPLKAAVKEAIKAKEAELTAITEYVRSEVRKITNSTLEKLREMDSSLATQLLILLLPHRSGIVSLRPVLRQMVIFLSTSAVVELDDLFYSIFFVLRRNNLQEKQVVPQSFMPLKNLRPVNTQAISECY